MINKGNIYAFGNNSNLQWTTIAKRYTTPYRVMSDFRATDIHWNDFSNIAESKEILYTWGASKVIPFLEPYKTEIRPIFGYSGIHVNQISMSDNSTVILSSESIRKLSDKGYVTQFRRNGYLDKLPSEPRFTIN